MFIKNLPYYVEFNFKHLKRDESFHTNDIKVLKEVLPDINAINIGDEIEMFNEVLTVKDIGLYNIYDTVKNHKYGENLKSTNLLGDVIQSLISITIILE